MLDKSVGEVRALFARMRGELRTKAGASEIEAALEGMTDRINASVGQQSRLEKLARKLGKDHTSSAAIKRLQIELEQVMTKRRRDTYGVTHVAACYGKTKQ